MSRLTVLVVALGLLFACQEAQAQSWEVSAVAAYTLRSASIIRRRADQLDIRGGFTWGVQGARWFTPNWGAEVLWTQQPSALKAETASEKRDFFTMTVGQLHGNVFAVRGRGREGATLCVRGIGATFFSAADLAVRDEAVVRAAGASSTFAGGAIGMRGHVRFKPTMLNDEDAG